MPARALTDVEIRSLRAAPGERLLVYDAKAHRDALTVVGLVERFIERYAKPRLRSWKDYEALLRRDLIPALGGRRAEAVHRTDIAALLDKVAARAPVLANRLQNAISSVFSRARSEGLVTANPVKGPCKRTKQVAKERVLSDEEIRIFRKVTAGAAPAFRYTLRLILLTGQRPGNAPKRSTWRQAMDNSGPRGKFDPPSGRCPPRRNHPWADRSDGLTLWDRLLTGSDIEEASFVKWPQSSAKPN
ncbi:phage integrase central domain-containing protein [Microvirga sp. G4-2]|uniref:phage integrase central domain-containing protein n=1 Tax=Microvirga sp. G4-2 TaxID=3434467 RepID=UPI004044A1B4